MAQLCLETVQIVRPFGGEVFKVIIIIIIPLGGILKDCLYAMFTMIRVMPGRTGADKKEQASKQSPQHLLMHKYSFEKIYR